MNPEALWKMNKANILIVEDNNIVMLELRDRLTEMGYVVVDTASSALEAIEKAEFHTPDLTMMDIRLKGEMDGIDAATIIKKALNIPIIYLTAHTDNNTLERAKITEPYGYIIKPFEERELHTTIEMALYKHSMERKLRESEHWLSSTLKSIGDALIATNPDGVIKLINPIAENITGWKYDEAFERDINDVFTIKSGNDHPITDNPVSLSLKNNSIVGASNKILISRNGKEIPIDFSAAPINYNSMSPAGVVLVFRDISERIKSKRIIEKQKIFLRNIIDTDPNYISVKNSNGKFELTNKAIAEALGESTENIQGKYDTDFYNEEEVKYQRKIDQEVINSLQEKFIPEDKLIDSDGKIHLLQTFKRAIDSQEGNEKLVLSVASDITISKQTEKALRESEERIKTLLKAIPDIVIRYQRNGTILDYHIQSQDEIIPNRNIIGENINAILEKGLAEQILLHSVEAVKTNQVQIFEFESTSNNQIYYREARIVNLPAEQPLSSQEESIVILRDITERKTAQTEMVKYLEEIDKSQNRLEQKSDELSQLNKKLSESEKELRELNASKDKFFSIIAHDLRGPFTTLLGFSEYLANEIDDIPEDELKVISENMLKASRATFNLLENLLQWSRVKTGRFSYDPEEIMIGNVIRKMIDLYSANAKNKNITLSINIQENLLVFADMNMVETILRNLISNAIKFTNIGGKISLSTSTEGNFAVISVQDNGIGLNESVKERIFQIDQNLSTRGTQNEEGSGLGLILCKEFVEINKGKIMVESEVGKGSTFIFHLPVKYEN